MTIMEYFLLMVIIIALVYQYNLENNLLDTQVILQASNYELMAQEGIVEMLQGSLDNALAEVKRLEDIIEELDGDVIIGSDEEM